MIKKNKVIIEVGAHDGTHTQILYDGGDLGGEHPNIDLEKNLEVYCFEPTPNLYLHLLNKYKENKNIKIFPFAVTNKNSFTKFNIANCSGCSSLNEFTDNVLYLWTKDGTPRNPNDFIHVDFYNVPTIKLESFIDLYNIEEIEYLWIDAQGSDFDVLKSLGNKINIVNAGQCEVGHDINLYKNTMNHYTDVKPWLEKNGFDVEIRLDRAGGKECDLLFKRKPNCNGGQRIT